jgi:hypothetical protein
MSNEIAVNMLPYTILIVLQCVSVIVMESTVFRLTLSSFCFVMSVCKILEVEFVGYSS